MFGKGENNIAKLEKQWLKEKKPIVFVKLCELYLTENRLDDAGALLEEGLNLFPKHTMGRILLSKLYIARGEKLKALDILEELLKEDPRNTMVISLLAPLYKEFERFEDALPLYEMLELIDSSVQITEDLNYVKAKIEELKKDKDKKEIENVTSDTLKTDSDEENRNNESTESTQSNGIDPKELFKIQVLKEQANQYLLEGKREIALEILKDVLKMNPSDSDVEHLIESLEEQIREDEAKSVETDYDDEEVPTLEGELSSYDDSQRIDLPVDEELPRYVKIVSGTDEPPRELSEIFGTDDNEDEEENEEDILSGLDMSYLRKKNE